jgi:hypothetical protein
VGTPVPRDADKAVRIERGHVVLVFKLWLEHAVQPEAQEVTVARAPEAVRAWAWVETEK